MKILDIPIDNDTKIAAANKVDFFNLIFRSVFVFLLIKIIVFTISLLKMIM